MTDLQASAPSTSSASASTPICYDIFLNHRGPDVKNTFASHLYHRFLAHGLQPFLDREELQAGDYLTPQIEGAIRTASVHITIFSPRYAESKWCLDELVLILKSGVTIIPVFYNVKPWELRWKGRYTEALNSHEQKGRYDPQTIENWRKALSEVSKLIGFELEAFNGDEGKLCESVVRCALKKCSKTVLHVATYPTGLQEKVEEFENIVSLQQQSGKVQILGIVGLGGVGKTTLAKDFFNRKSFEFKKSCFLFDVREIAGRNSLNFLQSKLLKGLTHVDLQLDTVKEGLEKLSMNLLASRALIVLDDVDDVAQLDAFLPLKDVLHSDSLILITSRNRDVLTSSGIADRSIYELTCLNVQHSQQLFCSHAFCQPYPPPGFSFLVDEFSSACNGLPLSLKVLGGLLCGNDNESYWEDQLFKLRHVRLPNEIRKCLQISYDALNAEDRQIFLDIACYFIGEDSDKAIRIWDGLGCKGSVGLLNLQNKCLVNVDRDNKIGMHDHLRDLGRDIADGEMPRRLWRRANDFQALSQQSRGITRVRGIRTVDNVIVCSDVRSTIPGIIITSFKSWSIDVLRKIQIGESKYKFLLRLLSMVKSQNLIWLSLNGCPDSYLPSWTPMKNLRVLDVEGNKFLWRGKSQAPLELRELNISAPLLKFPKSIGQLKHIERITVDGAGGQPEALPGEFCDLRSLKYLRLRRLLCMERLPASFGHLTNLQHLDLSGLMILSRLPDSFGDLIRLKYLNLRNCVNLTMSKETFGNIRTLEYLELSNCQSIKVLPLQLARQRSMEELHLLGMLHLKELPEDIGNLKNLELLCVGSPVLERLPRSLGQLRSLRQLRLEGCGKLECLPDDLGMLTQLSTMRLRACGIHRLPQGVLKMNNMVNLSLLWCPLRKLPWQELVEGETETLSDPKGKKKMGELDLSIYSAQHQPCMHRLEVLEIHMTEITEIFFPQGVCPNLKHLDIQDCKNLVTVGGLPHTLITVKLFACGIHRLPQEVLKMNNMVKLSLRLCPLRKLPWQELVEGETETLSDPKGKKRMSELDLSIYSAQHQPCMHRLEFLEILRTEITEIFFPQGVCPNLKHLDIQDCKNLVTVGGLPHTLITVKLFACEKLAEIGGLCNLTELQELNIKGSEVEHLQGLERLISLKKLKANRCQKLRRIQGLKI